MRDDGDVDAVLVRHIMQAIRRRAEPGNALGLVAEELRPVFQSNVGISAWGLAIHTQARILAVSSNAHEVRIFKFGLLRDVEGGEGGGEVSMSDASSVTDTIDESRAHRRLDVTQRVLNGNANIPHISFCNTGDDPEARWLLTTDISGYCRVMDLHSLHAADVTTQQFRFGRSYPGSVGGFDRLNAGWAIMFLDTRSFRPETDFRAALGLAEGEDLPANGGNTKMWDLSDTVEHVPQNSPAFVFDNSRQRQSRTRQRNSAQHQASERDTPSQESDSSQSSPIDSTTTDASAVASPVSNNSLSPNTQQANTTATDTEIDPAVEEIILDALDDLDSTLTDSPSPSPTLSTRSSNSPNPNPANPNQTFLIPADQDPEDEGTEDHLPATALYSGRRIFGNTPYFLSPHPPCPNLPCPLFHASVRNIYLLQPPGSPSQHHHPQQRNPSTSDPTPPAFTPPLLGLANPLRQALDPTLANLNLFDRLNMHAYIPALGVLVLASQKGRALVLELTKIPANPKIPNTTYTSTSTSALLSSPQPQFLQEISSKTVYAMRVKCILPFEEQESKGERPAAPLVGVACAPVQGCEAGSEHGKGNGKGSGKGKGSGAERWRVMLMFGDHGVLSYEVARGRSGEGGGAPDGVGVGVGWEGVVV